MTSRQAYVAPPGPRRRASDLQVVTIDELGQLSSGQRQRVIDRDAVQRTAEPTPEALLDAKLRQKFVGWSLYEHLPRLDAAIAARRMYESYGAVLEGGLDYMLDAVMRKSCGQ